MVEKVILVGVQRTEKDDAFQYSLEELEQLCQTAGGQVVATLTQKRERFDSKTVIGKGKMQELVALVDELQADTIVFQQELSPSHVRNIQEQIECKVIDRIQLILDIFALRARSKEGKLQVELAQLNYLLPRLSGQGKNMSRLGGGIGTRGPGETKLESDKRHIQTQISECKRQLKEVSEHRQRSREQRKNSQIFQIGLIGYTNAGKSTLINRLTDAKTYEQDQLFATLDPLTRQFKLCHQFKMTITDTVGFIQDIPTQLIHAFESTLEESRSVDFFIHVVDSSAENYQEHEKTVLHLLKELRMDTIPMITVYNKKDKIQEQFTPTLKPYIWLSTLLEEDIRQLHYFLWEHIQKQLCAYNLSYPLGQEAIVTKLTNETFVTNSTFNADTLEYEVVGFAKKTSPFIADTLAKQEKNDDIF
ncbi:MULTISPECIES: GTPase HflX [unclassified Granulicatella]|uniref:GTPase HflX n=1 Tax=unclassified Granulicatella TaxID=2630493 RepID=UPI0010736EE7|nr:MULTISPECIES: GTPase HflX [unclassified Granulicatella]MBF0780225.1 GTPase HflX [Granulicatella sp. 19428wC4_WM01]TFU95659.1 GTPase HflX [Granulicatella sp. WM01]